MRLKSYLEHGPNIIWLAFMSSKVEFLKYEREQEAIHMEQIRGQKQLSDFWEMLDAPLSITTYKANISITTVKSIGGSSKDSCSKDAPKDSVIWEI